MCDKKASLSEIWDLSWTILESKKSAKVEHSCLFLSSVQKPVFEIVSTGHVDQLIGFADVTSRQPPTLETTPFFLSRHSLSRQPLGDGFWWTPRTVTNWRHEWADHERVSGSGWCREKFRLTQQCCFELPGIDVAQFSLAVRDVCCSEVGRD